MIKKTRNILIVIGFLLLIFTGIIGYGVYRAYNFFIDIASLINRPILPEIKEPRILKGKDFLDKKEVVVVSDGQVEYFPTNNEGREAFSQSVLANYFWDFEDLQILNNEIIAISRSGGFVFDINWNLRREFEFEQPKEKIKIGWFELNENRKQISHLNKIKIVPLAKNVYGVLSYGVSGGAKVFDKKGKILWTYGEKDIDLGLLFKDEKERDKSFEESTHVLEAAVGDLDNDGKNELIEIGRRIRDGNGNELKKLEASFGNDSIVFAENEKPC